MAERKRCEICNRNFKSQEGLDMHNEAKHSSSKEEPKKEGKSFKVSPKKIKKLLIWLVILGLIVWGVSAMFSGSGSVLPPTDMRGHVEISPDSHVLREPIPFAVQKHMLEHADGTGSPGIIINYNCEDYSCETGLIENLETFSQIYPENVYIAPFENLGGKIVLTKLGRLEILEEYNKNKIHLFISGTIPGNGELASPTHGDSGQGQVMEELSSQETGETNVKEFDVIASQWKFSPSKIEVNEGDEVVLNVRSVDVAHGIAIPAFEINEYLSPGQTVRMEFVADRKGTFTFSCSVSCGVGHIGMIGKLIVK